MVRRSQSSNPRAIVVLTSGTDWGTRAAGQRRSSGAESPIPRRQPAKIKALQRTVEVVRVAISKKRWHEARYALSRAQALTNALPTNVAVQEREQLSALRKKYAARNTPAAKSAKQAKPTPAGRAEGKKPAVKKSTVKSTAPKPKAVPKPNSVSGSRTKARKTKRSPFYDFGDRFINRAALGYEPTDKA
ncbi:hypothetical protein ABZT08_05860 [Streptomyces sp. NPDC005526]|uniref:hypothetical protein n=1 Tax=Streptomyces sp. NPDC005526 TaxID=3156885 RepID=UPI0033B1C7AB